MALSVNPVHKQARLEGVRAAFRVVHAAFVEYLNDHENSDALTAEQKKAVISGMNCVLTSVKQNYVKLERAIVADDDEGIDVGGRKITPDKFTAADVARYADLFNALEKSRTQCSVDNFHRIVQGQRELLFTILRRSDSTVTTEEIADIDVGLLGSAIGAIARASLRHLWASYEAWPKPGPPGPVN